MLIVHWKKICKGEKDMETIKIESDGRKIWHWPDIKNDLVKQGGLEAKEITIDSHSVEDHRYSGSYKSNVFHVNWAKDVLLIIAMEKFDQALINAFTKVVEYKPFCRYTSKESGLITFEWNKKVSKQRFAILQEAGEPDLQKI